MSRILKKKYDLKNKKINKEKRLLLISDIHISKIFNIKKIDKIINELKKEKIDYICIPGDIIDCTNVLEEEKYQNIIIDFLEKLSSISKVIISLGNHDISRLRTSRKEKKWTYEKKDNFFNKIKKIKDVHLLDDAVYIKDDICFIGLTLSFDYYKKTKENKKDLLDELKNKNIKLDNNKYNVLLCHTPVHILDNELNSIDLIKNTDLILSGHMHNGMVHPIMEKIWKGKKGIITTTKKLYTKANLTRRIKNKDEKVLIISGGITKLSQASTKFLYHFNDIYPMHIEIININN